MKESSENNIQREKSIPYVILVAVNNGLAVEDVKEIGFVLRLLN